MRSLAGVLVGLLMCISANARAEDVSGSEKVVHAEFGSGVEGMGMLVSRSESRITTEVCADGCDVFQWDGSPRKSEVWDFILLYELKVGYGSDLTSFHERAQSIVKSALLRSQKYCRPLSTQDAAQAFDCSWGAFAKAHSIRVGTANYDEGQRCSAWVDFASGKRPDKWSCKPITRSPWGPKGPGK